MAEQQRDYWEERQAKAQDELTQKTIEETEEQLVKYYKRTMQDVIGQFEATYNKILLSIEDGKEPTPADLYKLDKYWEMQGQLKQQLQKLGDKQHILMSKKFTQEYEQIYRAIALKDDLFFGEIDNQVVQHMINQIWCADGKSWSSRIWGNVDKLQQALNDGLIECLVTGKTTSQLKNYLINEFNVSYNRADRIIRTEMAHIQTQAARQRYLDAGLTEVEVWASKDERRCEVCGKLHQKRFPIGGKMPIPAHSNCRCCIIPVIE
jgi:SPP1 gp7 family putative phage head morphogenesis protein